ncbi:MAG: diacylglycerol/polyprenol kinase family protein [Candidatus Sericytochromatia bacterium]
MEPILVLDTKTFAIRLYELLRDLDPARWGSVRKQALKSTIFKLEAEVYALYDRMQDLSSELEGLDKKKYPISALRETLYQVGMLLTELKGLQIDSHLSYVSLYALRKRLQKAYQNLSVMMEACQTPIPHIRPTNIARSLFHATNAMFVLLMIAAVPSFSWMFWIALAYMLFCITMEGLKRVNDRLKEKVMRFFSAIAHPHEYDKVNSATWYGAALVILSLLPLPLGIIGVAVLGFADPAAALVGRKFGQIKLPGNRTLEGSLTFFAVGTVASSLALMAIHPLGDLGTTLAVSASASACGAIGELAGSFPDDNLTIPVASAAGAFGALSLLGMI